MSKPQIKVGDVVTLAKPYGGGFFRGRVLWVGQHNPETDLQVVETVTIRAGDGIPPGRRGHHAHRLTVVHDVPTLPKRRPTYEAPKAHSQHCQCVVCFDAAHSRYLDDMARRA